MSLAAGYNEFDSSVTKEVKLPNWLFDDKYNIGYFTSTKATLNYKVYVVAQAGWTDYYALYNSGSVYCDRGLRPVITLAKTEIS